MEERTGVVAVDGIVGEADAAAAVAVVPLEVVVVVVAADVGAGNEQGDYAADKEEVEVENSSKPVVGYFGVAEDWVAEGDDGVEMKSQSLNVDEQVAPWLGRMAMAPAAESRDNVEVEVLRLVRWLDSHHPRAEAWEPSRKHSFPRGIHGNRIMRNHSLHCTNPLHTKCTIVLHGNIPCRLHLHLILDAVSDLCSQRASFEANWSRD